MPHRFARGADDRELGPEAQHRYLMMGTPPLSALLRGSSVRRSHFVTKDLPCFTPGTENFFVTDIRKNKGIQCRFGMRGVIAEAHYDGGRNMVLTAASRGLPAALRHRRDSPPSDEAVGGLIFDFERISGEIAT